MLFIVGAGGTETCKRSCTVLLTLGGTILYLAAASCFYVLMETKPCESKESAEGDEGCTEPWTLIDALYFTMVSMSTVGYGDLSPSNVASKVMTVFFVVFGAGVVFYHASQAVASASDSVEERVVGFIVRLLDASARDKQALTGRGAASGSMADIDGDGVADVVEPPGALTFWLQGYTFNVVVLVTFQLISATIFTKVQPGMDFGNALYLCCITATTVGYGDVPISTQSARLFSFFHILLSVSWLGAALAQLEPLRQLRSRQLQRMELLRRKLDESLITSLDRDGGGVNQTEFVVGMLINLGAELCGERLVWEDVVPFVQQFQSLDADGSGILTKADLAAIAQKQRQSLHSHNPKLAQKLKPSEAASGPLASARVSPAERPASGANGACKPGAASSSAAVKSFSRDEVVDQLPPATDCTVEGLQLSAPSAP